MRALFGSYADAFYVAPLIQFDDLVKSSFSDSPSKEKNMSKEEYMWQIARRTAIACISLFAYLTLGALALTGLALDYISQSITIGHSTKRVIPNPNSQPQLILDPNKGTTTLLFNVADEFRIVKERIKPDFDRIKASDQHGRTEVVDRFKSVKIFLDVLCGDKIIRDDFVVTNPIIRESVDKNIIFRTIEQHLSDIESELNIKSTEMIEFSWNVLLKDNKERIFVVSGNSMCGFNRNISTFQQPERDDWNAYFSEFLEHIGREDTPQLDDKGYFKL